MVAGAGVTAAGEAVLVVLAGLFAAMGAAGLVVPGRVVRQFGVRRLSRDGRSEVRAVYGGFGLATAAALLLAAAEPRFREGVTLAVGLALAGMAAGRVASAVADRGMSRTAGLYLAVEAAGALALWASA